MNPYEILYEDDDILAANKLSPLPVLKDTSGDEDLQSMLIREHLKGTGFLEAAHRIDRRTSGIVVFAKNAPALRKLEEGFREREIHKTYIACLEKEPVPAEGLLKHMIIVDSKRNISVARPMAQVPGGDQGHQGAVQADLAYKLLMKTERYFFVEAKPLTGRHHQIRAQFAAMGWSIKGDLKYGAKRSSQSGRIMLHGWRTEFEHPRTGETLSLTADFPTDETLWKVFAEYIATATKTA